MKQLVLCVILVACKGKGDAPGSALSGSAVVAPAPIDAIVVAPASAALDYEKEPDDLYKVIFGDRVPVLPALSADGEWIADFDSDSTGMMIPPPMYVAIRRADNTGTEERLELIDDEMAGAAQEQAWDPAPPAPIAKVMKERGAAVANRLVGFSSLVAIDVPVNSNGEPQPASIGSYGFTAVETEDAKGEHLVVSLADANKLTVRQEVVDSYSSDEKPASFDGGSCSYRPLFGRAFQDRAKAKVFATVVFRWNEECTPQDAHYIVWTLPGPTETAITKLATEQLDANATFETLSTADAQLISGTTVSEPTTSRPFLIKTSNETYTGHEDDNLQVVMSRDGQSAWTSLTTKLSILPQNEKGRDDPWRVSSVLVKTAAGWKMAATTWTEPVANAKANADAKAGKLPATPAFTVPPGDAALGAAFAKVVSDGIDAAAQARGDLVAFGSGPGERTVGGAVLARGWNAGWKGKATITSSTAKLAPSGTTGWVAAAVSLSKGSYKIPFAVFAVFDKNAAGAWTLVHMHISV